MIEKKYSVALAIELAQRFTVIFSLSIIAITITGMLIRLYVQDVREASTLFMLNSGLQYDTILQVACFSLIISFFSVLLFSEHIQAKINFLFRGLLLLLATLATTSIFAIIFNWFPTANIQSWINFVLCTIACFAFSFSLTLLKIKLEGKKYAKLLEGYKKRHNN